MWQHLLFPSPGIKLGLNDPFLTPTMVIGTIRSMQFGNARNTNNGTL
jgi:hypothetical protein